MFGARRFYHSSVRKLVIAFGSLFNDVRIARFNLTDRSKKQSDFPYHMDLKRNFR